MPRFNALAEGELPLSAGRRLGESIQDPTWRVFNLTKIHRLAGKQSSAPLYRTLVTAETVFMVPTLVPARRFVDANIYSNCRVCLVLFLVLTVFV